VNDNVALSPLATQVQTLADELRTRKKALSAVAARGVDVDRVIKVAVNAAQNNPALLKCTAASFFTAVSQGLELDLSPGSVQGLSWLVPYYDKTTGVFKAQLIPSAKGYTALMYRSGMVGEVNCEVVYKGDEFEFNYGLDPHLRHVPCGNVDPADVVSGWCVIKTTSGGTIFRVLFRDWFDSIRKRSPSASKGFSPWNTDYAEMCRKTVLKATQKYAPASVELLRAVALDNAYESGDMAAYDAEYTDAAVEGAEPLTTSRRVAQKAAAAAYEVADNEFAEEFSLEPAEPTRRGTRR
jgi:recombination protein RecT